MKLPMWCDILDILLMALSLLVFAHSVAKETFV
jgi:hypothetical protein